MTLEREVKLAVWPGFTMPDLADVADEVTVEQAPEQRLDATYHDTADLRLARWGITLRHRTGEGDDRWTLKLPKSSSASMLVRDEIDVAGAPRAVPAEIRAQVTAWVRSSQLEPVARLQTLRSRTLLRDGHGKQLAEIVDDEVSVLDGRHVALRFREVEAELTGEADERLLEEIVGRLRAAGAGAPDPTAKVVRALGPRALSPPELVVPELDADATAADVLRAGIAKAVLRVLQNDAGVRLTDDVESVHQARVGTRRLRSDLRTFAPLVDTTWSDALRAELSWFADLLGAVRDADVLIERIERDLEGLSRSDAAHAGAIQSRLGSQRDAARVVLRDAMGSDRYVALLDRMVNTALDPKVLPKATGPAATLLPRLAAKPWDALAKAVKKAGNDPADEVLHAIRIRAKRARYAADVAALVIGKPAARFADAVAGVQEVLGDHQDACVRRAWLRGASSALTPEAALVAGQLVAAATAAADQARDAFPEAWKRANAGRLRTWLSR